MSTEFDKTEALDSAPLKTSNKKTGGAHSADADTKHTGISISLPETNKKITLKQRFILDKVIAKGGMGIIYRARDIRKIEAQDADPYVAIKLLRPDNKKTKTGLINLQRETRKTQILSHPNIVNVHDFDRDGDNFMMIMEYLRGEALSRYIKKLHHSQRPARSEVFRLIRSIANALIHAHDKNIIHCDLKPANIFICKDGTVKVLDFGIARAFQVNEGNDVNENLNQGISAAMTPTYASCEMLSGTPPEHRDDIYSLACIAYELLSGRHPFNRQNCLVARQKGLVPVSIEGLSRRQWKVLTSALSFSREDRPASVLAFIKQLLPHKTLHPWRSWALVGFTAFVFSILILGNRFLFNPQTQAQQVTQAFESLQQAEQEKVLSLLEIADAHMLVQRYTEPPGSNAYTAYKAVLKVHPGNPQALAGIDKIADVYVRLVRNYIANDNNQTALELVKEGLDIHPQHKTLQQLLRQLR